MRKPDLAPFTPTADDPFDFAKAAHLFRRAAFGAPADAVRAAVEAGPMAAVRSLLAGADDDDGETRSAIAIGDTASHGSDVAPLRAAFALRLVASRDALRERMTLFWHGHFATANAKVQSPRLMWLQHLTMRRLALAPFGDLLSAMTRDPAMLVFLDGKENRKGHPNENYARELFELFALGIGNYGERDVKEAARALTGLSIEDGHSAFRASRHDDGEKTIFGRTGAFGPDDLLSMTLDLDAAAPFLARKFARLFIADAPDEDTVAALAESYRASRYDTAALVGTILRSRLFYSDACRAARVRGPVEFVAGAARSLGAKGVPPNDVARALEEMGQSLFDPPNVKGWDGGRAWISTATWLRRLRFSSDLAASGALDPGRVAAALGVPLGDDAAFAEGLASVLVPGPARPDLRDRIAAAGRSAGGDDAAARARAAVRFVLSLPEAQLG